MGKRSIAERLFSEKAHRTKIKSLGSIKARRCIAHCAALCLIWATPVSAEVRVGVGDILNLIARYEAPGGYNQYYTAAPFAPPRRLTSLTIGEVLIWQQKLRSRGTKSTAVGRYQIIYKTLRSMVNTGVLPKTALFNAANQDRLARALLKPCLAYQKFNSLAPFGNCLAGIWAAFPMHSGPLKGKSKYHAVAQNRALVSVKTVERFLKGEITLATLPKTNTSKSATARARTFYVQDAFKWQGYEILTVKMNINTALEIARSTQTLGKSIRVRKYTRDPYQTD